MIKILTTILLLIPLISFTQTYTTELTSISDFTTLSGLPLSDKYGDVSALKLVYDIKNDKIYYVNSRFYMYHYEFCTQQLSYITEVNYFNEVNYSNNPKRRFLLANINYFKSLETYALELSPTDLMSNKDIKFLYDLVSKTTFIGDSLTFLLNSSRLNNLSDSLSIPTLSPSEIYKNLDYQAISKHKRCGVLRFINNLDSATINPMDIIVIQGTPLFLPKVNGVITNTFQTPLSHLSILGQNRKIPIAAITNAFTDSTLISYNGQKVCLKILNNNYTIEKTNKLTDSNEPTKSIKLQSDLTVDTLIPVEYLNKKSYKYVGNKASNFGTLYKISLKNNFKVPESTFAIPFYFYNQHIINSGTQQLIDSLLSNQPTNTDSLKYQLKQIRKQIKKSPVNPSLITSINNKATESGYTQLRFRSSTNAEDAKGFSGAGLYTSKTGILNDTKKTYEKAIKKVWASLWSYEAYAEREYYQINHKEAYMGVLVHRSFPNEDVNGVAITKNLYRPDSYGFVVNCQLGNENVVKPTSGTTTDQFICYPNNAANIYENKTTVDIITQSSLNDNKLVMTEPEIQNLANQLEVIKKYFVNHSFTSKYYLEYALDIEFKLDKERELYIKQVRLFND